MKEESKVSYETESLKRSQKDEYYETRKGDDSDLGEESIDDCSSVTGQTISV